MHGVDRLEPSKPIVQTFAFEQTSWNDADDLAVGTQCAIGNCPHQTSAAPAVHEFQPTLRDQSANALSGLDECRVIARARAAKNAQSLHGESTHAVWGLGRR